MSSTLSKSEIIEAVQSLPDGVDLEDVIEHLLLLDKVRRGLQEVGQGLPQSEVEEQFKLPRDQRVWNRG